MQEFLNIALGFPTVIWTGLLGVVAAYWLFVIVGALDLDVLDAHIHIDPEFDVDFDLDADVDADVDAPASPLVNIAVALGIGKVPVTILISLFGLSGWVVSYFSALWVAPMLKFGAIGAVILGVAFIAAVPLMGAMAHPLKKVFETHTRRAGAEVIGSICIISTGTVDDGFGQARLDDGGAGLLLNVRCETANNGLKKNSQALIIGHDRETDVYFIEPYEQFLPTEGVELDTREELSEQIDNLVNAKREG